MPNNERDWHVTDEHGNHLTKQMAEEVFERLGAKSPAIIRGRVSKSKWTVEEAITIHIGGYRNTVDQTTFPRSFQRFIADFCGGRPVGFPALKLGI